MPPTSFDAKLGAVSYQGDPDLTGDSLLFNTTALSDAINPVDNVFNSTRSYLGTPVSVVGDLPQLSGAPGSMNEMDMDVFDVTSLVKAGDRSAVLTASSSGDTFFLASFVTAVSTVKPVFTQTSKTATNITRNTGDAQPGDIIEYTITTKNTGADSGVNVVLTDKLPASLTYVPGSLSIVTGANSGKLTDATGDDQGDYGNVTRTVTVRLGSGANALTGGTITTADAVTTVKFRVTVDTAASGIINNQAAISAQGDQSVKAGSLEAGTWLSGDGTRPNVPTAVIVDSCQSNADCPARAPVCDMQGTPKQCVCKMDSDCPGACVCDTTASRTCVACLATDKPCCDPKSVGGACLSSPKVACGCTADADCGGRTCNVTSGTCPVVNVDLGVTIARQPDGAVSPGQTVTFTTVLSNLSTIAVYGASVTTALPTNVSGITWACMAQGGAVCPAQSGAKELPRLVNLPAGGSLTFTVTAPLASNIVGANVAYGVTVMAPDAFTDTNLGNNTATVSVPLLSGPDLSIAVTPQPAQGDTLSYAVSVHNNGAGDAPGLQVSYNLPDGVVFVSRSGDGWSCMQMQQQLLCVNTAPLAAGADAPLLDITVRPPANSAGQSLAYSFSVAGQNGSGMALSDPDPSNNTASGETPVSKLMLAGGGFSCAVVSARTASSALPVALFALLFAALTLRRRLGA